MNGVFYAKCHAPFHLCFMPKDWWNLKSTLVVHLNNKKISIWDLIFFVRSIWHQSWNLNYGVKLWQKCFMKGIEPFLPCAISKFGFAPIGWWYWYKATFVLSCIRYVLLTRDKFVWSAYGKLFMLLLLLLQLLLLLLLFLYNNLNLLKSELLSNLCPAKIGQRTSLSVSNSKTRNSKLCYCYSLSKI